MKDVLVVLVVLEEVLIEGTFKKVKSPFFLKKIIERKKMAPKKNPKVLKTK